MFNQKYKNIILIFFFSSILAFFFLNFFFLIFDINKFFDLNFKTTNKWVHIFFNPIHFLNLLFFFNFPLTLFFNFQQIFSSDWHWDYIWFLYADHHISINNLIQLKYNNFCNSNVITINELPLFFYFGVLFFLTTSLSFLFFNFLGLYGVFIINLISLFLFWFSLIFYFQHILINGFFFKITIGKWFYLNVNYLITFDFLCDKISFSFMFLTASIAVFVYAYAFSYFRYEPLVERLLLFLCSFILSMVFLVNSGNLIMMFLGWELIGLTSFFLINFWVTRIGTLKAAFKAFVFNKISDFFFFFFILLVFLSLYDVDVLVINSQLPKLSTFKIIFFNTEFNLIEISSFLLISCAFIKSAQFGAHLWLPDSMEAPVPASALIHSATLVSAGIFLILRFHNIIELSTYCSIIVPLIGSFTAVYGGLVAAFQSDIKRILAYSTISHCGFLMVISMLFSTEFTVFYLYVHGFFKATVFLNVGNVIRFSKNYQDFRRMGGLYKYLPFDCFLSFLCLANLAGLPFSLGFFMKHFFFLIISKHFYFYLFIFLNVFFGALCGLFYSYRLFYNVFFDFKKGRKIIYLQNNTYNYNHYAFSNTTLASNIAISLLFIVAYTTIIYLYLKFTSNLNIFSDFDNSVINTSFYLKNYHNLNTNFNSAFINWVVILLMFMIIFSSFRARYNNYNNIQSLFDSLVFFIFFYFFFYLFSI